MPTASYERHRAETKARSRAVKLTLCSVSWEVEMLYRNVCCS